MPAAAPVVKDVPKAEKVQAEENNELLAENLNRRRQQLFRQEMGSRLKSKINATAAASFTI